jgi:hypothetical protein
LELMRKERRHSWYRNMTAALVGNLAYILASNVDD